MVSKPLLVCPCSYLPERARSRSPVSRSQSPRSHSPSFTSCSSAHSPPGPPGRPDWSNGMGPRRGSWDWSSHLRGDDDPRDRDVWRNGEEDRPNGWLSERRKPYLKSGDRNSPRMGPGDERGRDWYPRGSPQGSSFSSSYHSIDDFYKKDSLYKSDKQSRSQHHRHEGKSKRREVGDHRPRHSESDVIDDTSSNRMAEDRGRSKRSSRRQEKEERESENQASPTHFCFTFVYVQNMQYSNFSPNSSLNKPCLFVYNRKKKTQPKKYLPLLITSNLQSPKSVKEMETLR